MDIHETAVIFLHISSVLMNSTFKVITTGPFSPGMLAVSHFTFSLEVLCSSTEEIELKTGLKKALIFTLIILGKGGASKVRSFKIKSI